QADKLKDQPQNSDLRARMLYEAAWCYRALAELEIASAREQLQKEQWQKLKDEAAKNTPPGQTPPSVAPPEVAQAAVPEQPSTKKAHALYEALIEDFGDTALATDARFELAELLAGQGQWEQVEKQLSEALDKEPAAELTDKVRLRLGESHAAKGDFAAALTEFEAVAQNPKSPLAGQAQYRAGECLFRAKDYEKAVAHLAVFRDQQPFQNLPGVTDRALLRLGEALAHLGRWDQSRQALEQLVNRFGSSPWVPEARYGMGWAWQNQKQYDNAVNAYNQVAAGTETGAKAQLQIGLCRLEQKRYAEAAVALMAVPYTYDYPELNAAALCEAGRALVELKQPDQAVSLWRRVLQDHPQSEWAKVAKERLNKVTK
ncbi:MAG: tetratricopeptide repeat protein, partial [Planctomycetes bacterium]|nr:tetratricopeptide repeat protein [Planctomycetota bacterium]